MIALVKKIQKSTNLNEQEAWWALQHITQKSKEQLLLLEAKDLSDKEYNTISDWIKKLSQESMPLAYLIGSVPFLKLSINVETPMLIPRPETEEWVDKLMTELEPYKSNIKNILEIGTGSGCIAIALAQHFDQTKIIATDINEQALTLAQKNAKINNITNIQFIHSDLFENIKIGSCFDLIISNPPYIDPQSEATMMPQVTQWEDKQALFASKKGLDIILQILQQAPQFLCKNSQLPYQLVLEHDRDQHESIKKHAHQLGWTCSTHKDLFGNWRTSWLTFQDQQ